MFAWKVDSAFISFAVLHGSLLETSSVLSFKVAEAPLPVTRIVVATSFQPTSRKRQRWWTGVTEHTFCYILFYFPE